MLVLILLVGPAVLAVLSFISSARGRFPILAIPAILISGLLTVSFLMPHTGAEFLAFFSAVPVVLGVMSLRLYVQKRRSRDA
jgi:hypothetical protein